MPATPDHRAQLLFADGTRLTGEAIGAQTTVAGELCFNTSMTGYQEVFTDPSYYGQLLVTTHTHIGNYGVVAPEAESDAVQIRGLVCKNFSEIYSRINAQTSLQAYLARYGVPGIAGIDTRAIVRHIRTRGAMNAVLSTDGSATDALETKLAACPDMAGLELARQVTTQEAYGYGPPGGRYKLAVLDYGIKQNILRSLSSRDFRMQVFPADSSIEALQAFEPDAFFLSNGPGDPAAMPYAVETARKITQTGKPVFGICLGHQILAQVYGLPTYKMRFGHRGVNHPVKNLLTGRVEITSQNHGFTVSEEAFQGETPVEMTHLHLNDHTSAGLRVKHQPIFSVQYHPEANPGPHDSRYLFDDFVRLIDAHQGN
jgi:carbamoyl-phosphate synthase small subunit